MAWNEPGGNGKDPWGHRKNEQGPPDLDEIVKKLQDKLNGLFGKGGSGGGGASGDTLSWTMIGIILLIIFIIWLLFGFYIVQPAEQGVETRFGAYTRMTNQGLNWHWPYPIEQVQKVNVEQVRAVSHKALMLTQDENIVEIELAVQYRVKDAKDYLFIVREPDKTLHQATESALRESVGTSKMDDVLTRERDRIAAETKELIQTILDRYKTGLIVQSVNMQNAQPPMEVQDAFDDVIKAREDEERSKNMAEAYANEVVQRARGVADRMRQEAQAYKAQVSADAEGQTQRFLSVLREYEKAPEITRKRLYLEAMESVLSKTTKIMIDLDSGNNLMVMPLDRILGGRRDFSNQPMSPNNDMSGLSTPPSASSYDDRRSREDIRSRGSR